MRKPGRIEDHRLLTGAGAYVADGFAPGMVHAVFARADQAGVRLTGVDIAAAFDMPGVLAILTDADLVAAGIPDLPQEPLPQDEGGSFHRPTPLLARDRLRHVGEPVAMVLAETPMAARDAADLIGIDSADDPEPPVTAFAKSVGQAEATAAALSAAAHRFTRRIDVPRVHAVPLEPRGCMAVMQDGRLHLTTSCQSPTGLVAPLADLLGLPRDAVRVSAGDVGGSFGLKGFLSREEALVAFAARHLGRPVGWIATRSESFAGDHNGRGVTGSVTLGLDADLRFVALSGDFTIDSGAYVSPRAMGVVNNIGGLVGVYDIPLAHAMIRGRTSDRTGIAPYRGHGRPEMTLALEQVIEAAARALHVDPVDLRRRNLIARDALPYRTALTFTLDSGDFAGVMDRALDLSDAAGADARRADAASRGRLFGRALILCVEAAGGPVRKPRPDTARLTATADGQVVLMPGVMSTGQGHETTLTGMVAAALGIAPDRIAYVQGDSDILPEGRGNGGSSGLAVTGPALAAAVEGLVTAARQAAATSFGCDPDRVVQDGEMFRLPGTNLVLSLAQLAGPGGLTAQSTFAPEAPTFPNGAHVCEVEVDPETGHVDILCYTAVEDVGTVLNPALVEGQMQGGITQGVSQVLGERMVHDDTGQVLTGSFMDYHMHRTTDLIPLRLASHPVPTPTNPLGVKGVGEAGTVGSVAALMCALQDALSAAGVTEFQMPATPSAIWAAIEAAR